MSATGRPERESVRLHRGDALLVVDVQNDFIGGTLAVPGADRLIPALNRYIAAFTARGLPVLATRDWHPADHCSFRERGGPWPGHCVAGTHGADFHPALALPPGAAIVSKATAPEREAYSSFAGTDLDQRLAAQDVRRLFIGGLATDYCVVQTTRDALQQGYEVCVLADAIGAVDASPGDGARAIADMRTRGAAMVTLADLAEASLGDEAPTRQR